MPRHVVCILYLSPGNRCSSPIYFPFSKLFPTREEERSLPSVFPFKESKQTTTPPPQIPPPEMDSPVPMELTEKDGVEIEQDKPEQPTTSNKRHKADTPHAPTSSSSSLSDSASSSLPPPPQCDHGECLVVCPASTMRDRVPGKEEAIPLCGKRFRIADGVMYEAKEANFLLQANFLLCSKKCRDKRTWATEMKNREIELRGQPAPAGWYVKVLPAGGGRSACTRCSHTTSYILTSMAGETMENDRSRYTRHLCIACTRLAIFKQQWMKQLEKQYAAPKLIGKTFGVGSCQAAKRSENENDDEDEASTKPKPNPDTTDRLEVGSFPVRQGTNRVPKTHQSSLCVTKFTADTLPPGWQRTTYVSERCYNSRCSLNGFFNGGKEIKHYKRTVDDSWHCVVCLEVSEQREAEPARFARATEQLALYLIPVLIGLVKDYVLHDNFADNDKLTEKLLFE